MEKMKELTREEEIQKENEETVRRIAEEIEAVTQGIAYRCPECGKTIFSAEPNAESVFCEDCQKEIKEAEPMTMYDYFDDFLDIDYIVNYNKEYTAARVCVGFGGPNIYVDTEEGAVCLYWGSSRAKWYLTYDAIDAVNDWAEDLYNCM